MSYNNLRTGRASLAGHVYCVTTVTAKRQPLFQRFELGRIVVNVLRAADFRGDAITHAFVVMPDHLHWLMTLTGRCSLAEAVGRMKGASARRINRFAGRQGVVWQTSFHDHAVRREESLITIARYIVMNPIRRGLVAHVGDYPLWDAQWL